MALKESNKNRTKRIAQVVEPAIEAITPPTAQVSANQWNLYAPSVFIPAIAFFALFAILFF